MNKLNGGHIQLPNYVIIKKMQLPPMRKSDLNINELAKPTEKKKVCEKTPKFSYSIHHLQSNKYTKTFFFLGALHRPNFIFIEKRTKSDINLENYQKVTFDQRFHL